MVASANSDVYTPFPQGMILEDGPQSSEDGSGLHSPIFGAPFPPHGDSIRYHPDQLDIQNAAGILASQFDYNGLSLPTQQGAQHLLETPLDLHSNGHHHPSYPSEFPLPPRNQLGLDVPPHSFSNARLPPPPAQGGPVNLGYQSSHRRYSGEEIHDHGYSSGGGSVTGLQTEGDQRSAASRRDSAPQPAAQSQAQQQPTPTSQDAPRREISNQVIACRQCRARKIRCDSTRPVCHNCVRRSNDCQYDAAPKRRGPDKRPGTRQRSCKKRPADGSAPPPSKRKRTAGRGSDSQESDAPQARENGASSQQLAPLRTSGLGEDTQGHIRLHQTSLSPQNGNFSPSVQSRALSGDGYSTERSDKIRLPSSPSVQFNRKIWWDELVNSYSATRDQSLKDIAADLSSLFTTTGYWLSFVNVPDFVRSLYNPEDRSLMQPSLVLAGLALATLMKSSEMELGTAGRNRALWLRDAAQSSLEASWSTGWIDMTLAKAAVILAVFESSAHPQYTPERAKSSLILLDNIVRALQLTFLDSNEPDVSTFTPHSVPIAHRSTLYDSKEGVRSPRSLARKCSCIPLPPNSSIAADHFSSAWSYTPPWDPEWTPEEMHREACRRLCWSALNLVASYTSHCIAFRKEPVELFLTDPANYRLLFPGEVSERGTSDHKAQSPKDSVWALYCRSMLLWNFCTTRLRKPIFNDEDRVDNILEAWAETQYLQDALDAHTCNLDSALLYMCREYIYNTQMSLTQTLQSLHSVDVRSLPSFNRKQAEQWLYYQNHFIRRVKLSIHHLGDTDGDLFTRRPFQVTWFASQVAICLSLWEKDNSLLNALDVAKDILVPVDVLNTLWPCPILLSKCDELRKRLTAACNSTHIPLPLPPNCSLPPHVRPG
ncbi:hypothetical protein BJ138DRAFT_1151604 [Hygrophoropsis aurantiaca]|uniref:Uncharacterized protein n=1 Tax=Hygrophoropsis aurantiaca TaxID=72124 RepID=A0ACB8AD31_9AGAM|nr:hypothetical protein BJ138DRAFT_1151604 [Hygrophoropsis aurantiaca]